MPHAGNPLLRMTRTTEINTFCQKLLAPAKKTGTECGHRALTRMESSARPSPGPWNKRCVGTSQFYMNLSRKKTPKILFQQDKNLHSVKNDRTREPPARPNSNNSQQEFQDCLNTSTSRTSNNSMSNNLLQPIRRVQINQRWVRAGAAPQVTNLPERVPSTNSREQKILGQALQDPHGTEFASQEETIHSPICTPAQTPLQEKLPTIQRQTLLLLLLLPVPGAGS